MKCALPNDRTMQLASSSINTQPKITITKEGKHQHGEFETNPTRCGKAFFANELKGALALLYMLCAQTPRVCSFAFVRFENANCQPIMFCPPNIYSAQLKLNELVMYKCMIFHFQEAYAHIRVFTCWLIRRNIFVLFDIYGFQKEFHLIQRLNQFEWPEILVN